MKNKTKTRLNVAIIASALIAAFITGFISPIAGHSFSFAESAGYSASNNAEFLHNITKLNGNADRPASLTFMHHGLDGSYGSLSGIAKHLAADNNVDIYFARIAGELKGEKINGEFIKDNFNIFEPGGADNPTYVYYPEKDLNGKDLNLVSPSDPGDPRFRNLTVYNETLRAVVDHDSAGRVIYNGNIPYDETRGDKTENGIKMYASRQGGLAEFKVKLVKFNTVTNLEYNENPQRGDTTEVDTIVNPSKHSIILFNSNDNKGSHSYIYNEFNAIVDKLSYDMLLMTGVIPRINLVSHSMGGVITMMYMTEHPYNVANYISIDSPHNFINLVSIAEALLLPLLNMTGLPGFDYDDFGIRQDDIYMFTLMAEAVLPIFAFANLFDPEIIDELPKPNSLLAFGGAIETIFSERDEIFSDDMAAIFGLPSPSPSDVFAVMNALGEIFDLPWLGGLLTYNAEQREFTINLNTIISEVLSNEKIAELLNSFGEGKINITPDNITPAVIQDCLSQIGQAGKNAFWFAIEWEITSKFADRRLGSVGAVQNFMNPYTYEKRKTDWNALFENGAETPNVNALAIGASVRIDFLLPVYNEIMNIDWQLAGDEMEVIANNDLYGKFQKLMSIIIRDFGVPLSTVIYDESKELFFAKVDELIAGLNGAEDISSEAAQRKLEENRKEKDSILAKMQGTEATDETAEELSRRYYRLDQEDGIMRMSSEMKNWFRSDGSYIYIEDDIFIDLDSTLAVGYKNFSRYNRIFTVDDRDRDYTMDQGKNVLSVHGAVLDCPDVKDEVLKNLYPLTGGAYSDIFETKSAEDGVIITGFCGDGKTEIIAIPTTLNGQNVIGIGDNAFANQSGLKTVIIMPASLLIGEGAFLGCSSLENIEFYNGGNLIKSESTINNFNKETIIKVPQTIKIGAGAFSNCPIIVGFEIGANGSVFHDVYDGVLYNKDMTELLCYASGRKNVLLNIPDGVIKIGNHAIQNVACLTNINLNKVKTVGNDVFKNCNNIGVIYAGNLEYIESPYLRDTVWFANNSADYIVLGKVLVAYSGNASEIYLENYTCIGSKAFSNSSNLTAVYITDLTAVLLVAGGAFDGAAKLSMVYVSKQYIDWYNANLNWQDYQGEIKVPITQISFDLNGGKSNDTNLLYGMEAQFGGVFFVPNTNKRIGFDFTGWKNEEGYLYTNGDNWLGIANYATLTAEWKEKPIYRITYSKEEGQAESLYNDVYYNEKIGDSLTVGELIGKMPTPEREYYVFVGWCDSEDETGNMYDENSVYEIMENLYLYAVFAPNFYTVKYNYMISNHTSEIQVDKDRMDASTGYILQKIAEVQNDLNGNLPYEKYFIDNIFKGWYDNSQYKGQPIDSILLSDGDRIFYAKWESIEITFEFNSNGGSVVAPKTMPKSEAFTYKLPESIRGGFKGTWDGFDFGGIYPTYQISEIYGSTTISLAARWEEKTFWECFNGAYYELYLENQLKEIPKHSSAKIVLRSKIDLTSDNWTPISSFKGEFDGGGNTISNMTITIPVGAVNGKQYYGLFDIIEGTVKNLKMTNVSIKHPITGDNSQHGGNAWIDAGGLCGRIQSGGFVEDVIVEGSIACDRSLSSVGGITGSMCYGTIKNSSFEGTLGSNGDMGGISGTVDHSTVDGCTVTAQMSVYIVSANRSIGGLAGHTFATSTIANSTVSGSSITIHGYGLISGQDVKPSIGLAVGSMTGGSFYGNNFAGLTFYNKALTSDYQYNRHWDWSKFGYVYDHANQVIRVDYDGDGFGYRSGV